jgi:glycosyltransferase involved in cell wall biosynthesis/ubiquinone/menaquinone biosynthesis C-methylase UbiE
MGSVSGESPALLPSGERYLPSMHGTIELEHLHRYLFAKHYVGGKRVLDIACGEGYGSSILSQSAAKVIGVDISQEAVAHATSKYPGSNLEFRYGSCQEIPLDEASVDVVISFETIEHHAEHDEMMSEIKRVLTPGGLLIMSCPDKLEYSDSTNYSNPFHVKELYKHEFKSLLEKNFKHQQLAGQRVLYGSAIFSEGLIGEVRTFMMDDVARQEFPGVSHATYMVALASDAQLPLLISGVLEQSITDSAPIKAWLAEVERRDAQIEAYQNQAKQFVSEIQSKQKQIEELTLINTEQILVLQEAQQNLVKNKVEKDSLTVVLSEIQNSRSWSMLKPIRWMGKQRARYTVIKNVLPLVLTRAGGWLPLISRVVFVWHHDGLNGVKAVVKDQVKTKPAYLPIRPQIGNELQPTTSEKVIGVGKHSISQRDAILFVSHEASRTGAPVLLLDVIRYVKNDLKIDCVTLLGCGGELEGKFAELGKTYILADRGILDLVTFHQIKKHNIKFIYSNTITNGGIQSKLQEMGLPILCHVHELGFSIESYFGKENLKRILKSTTKFLAGSKAVEEYLVDRKGVSRVKVDLAYPFINVAANEKIAINSAYPLNVEDGEIIIGACGTISWRKGTDIFLQVAKKVIDQYAGKVKFVWLGGPITQGEYRNLQYDAQQLGIDNNVIFTGSVSSHVPYFSRFDIFVLTSREDPFPLVVLDAASLGKPTVCFENSGGAPEFVEDDAGIVVPYLNLDQMSSAIIELILDQSLRRKFGKRAQEKVMQRHDVRVGGARIVEIVKPYLLNVNEKDV